MDETPAAHDSVGGIVAVGEPVDDREIAARSLSPMPGALARRAASSAWLMRSPVLGWVESMSARAGRFWSRAAAGAAERSEEARGAEGVEAGPGENLHPGLVGVEFLRPRKARKREACERSRTSAASSGLLRTVCGDLADQRRLCLRLRFAPTA